jgi:hypothetical protein
MYPSSLLFTLLDQLGVVLEADTGRRVMIEDQQLA